MATALARVLLDAGEIPKPREDLMHDLDRQQLEHYEQTELVGEHGTGELTETQEMELAAQFLEIASEAELEEFLGDLFQRAKAVAGDAYSAASRAYKSDLVQKQVLPTLKTVGRTVIPLAVSTGVNYLAPGHGAEAGRAAKQLTDYWLREELEGLSGEDREFELARSYVRFAMDALQRALDAPPRVPGPVAAQIAVTEAAREHAPGLVPVVPQLVNGGAARGAANGAEPSSGRWVRQGSSIAIDLG